ncbi:cytochrome c3 family protein [Bacteroidota bacterium]
MNLKANYAIIILLAFVLQGKTQTIVNSRHNLSVSGRGKVKSLEESGICDFCHVKHSSNPKKAQWLNKKEGKFYTLYSSSTLQALPGQPDGSSILCLSCHDGTTALGHMLAPNYDIGFSAGLSTMPTGGTNLSTDLSDDHPISFIYNSHLATADGNLKDPASIMMPMKLENEKVQCTSCHDPHKNMNSKFLVVSNQYSELCISCHLKEYWLTSAHRNSPARWNGSGNNPWFHTAYTSVSENACENCHNPHSAGGKERLLKYETEENNCLDCHNGNVAKTNIQAQLNKPYKHDVYNQKLVHDANEEAIITKQHAECSDCHNPHSTCNNTASAPYVKGFNMGTRGVDQKDQEIDPVQYEYEICYRCHSESPDKPQGKTKRQIEQSNVRLEFDQSNPSFHPIVSQGKNMDVPSLISPISESTIIYCTDCHASDGQKSPSGPHGSIYPQILKFNYNRDGDTYSMSYNAYELCYQCHDMNTLKNTHAKIGPSHSEMTSCNTCHDPHGISSSQGNSINNAYLINFNTAIVSTNSKDELNYISLGSGRGLCSIRCHDHEHNKATYPKL